VDGLVENGILNLLLKKLSNYNCHLLCYIFDSSFKTHCISSQWLQAFVFPVFKKGATSDPAIHRPVSHTFTCCRVIKRVNNTQLTDCLLRNKFIRPTKHQKGFLTSHFTCTNLLETINDQTNIALFNRHKTDALYVNIW
jgi:hypothetical protein